VLKHFTIGLLSELRQQVKYEQAETYDEAMEVAGKKKKRRKFHDQLCNPWQK
jgi:hypothetical protein